MAPATSDTEGLSEATTEDLSNAEPVLRALLVSDLVGSTKLVEELGDSAAHALFERHDRLARDLLGTYRGREIDKTDGFLLLFERSWNAVRYALAYHAGLRQLSAEQGRRVAARVGIHLGEVILRRNPPDDVERGAKPLEVEGLAKPTAARLMSLAQGSQTLLTRNAFDPARRAAVGAEGTERLRWLAHGPYRFQGVEEQVEVFEVGEEGQAPLTPPPESEKVKRVSAAQREPVKTAGLWNVPFERDPFFTGRDAVLATLREALTGAATRRRSVTISGLGGIGKTQTAVEYAFRYRDHYDAVFWIAAETVADLEAGYVEIARRLDLPEKKARQPKATVRAVLRWLETNDSWLLILDNADTPQELRGRLPSEHRGHILLTSRAQAFGRVARPLQLTTLPAAEAEAFFLKRAQRSGTSETEREAVAALARELGYLPLALEQAGAYVEETGATFEAYLSGFRRRRLKLLDEETAPPEHPPVATTWEMNFDKIEKTSAASADLLRVCGFLAPDSIPVELIVEGAPELGTLLAAALEDTANDELRFDELLKPLRRYSLIQRDAVGRTFSIHRLVQEAVKARMSEDTRKRWSRRIVSAVAQVLPRGRIFESGDDRRRAERLYSQGRAAARLVDRWTFESGEASLLLNQLGICAVHKNIYQEAESFCRKALTMRRRQPAAEQPRVVDSLLSLAEVLNSKGAYEEVETLCREVLAISRRQRGTDPRDVAESLALMGITFFIMRAYDEAERHFRDALSLVRREVGDDHPLVARSLFGLGLIASRTGDSLEKAGQFQRQAAAISRRLAHPFWPMYQVGLASGLVLKGAFEEAETLGREALAAARQLADEIQGREHHVLPGGEVAYILSHLAFVLCSKGSHEEAEQLYREALVIQRRQFGDEHFSVARCMSNLARMLVLKGACAEAERFCDEAMAIWRWPERHPDLPHGLTSLALLRVAQGRYVAAEELQRQALEIQRRVLPSDSFWIARDESVLGAALTGQERYEESEELLTRCLPVLRAKTGDKSPLTRQALENLVELYEAWGKAEKAAEYRARLEQGAAL